MPIIPEKTSQEMISQVAAAAVLSVKEVGSLVNGPTFKPAKSFELYRGIVVVPQKDGSYQFDIYLNIRYGEKIPQTAFSVQEAVKNAEDELGITAAGININIQGVDFPEEEKAE